MSRDYKDLIPEMQTLYLTFDEEMKKQGQDYVLTCTYRSQEEQDALYNIGRTTPGRVVTWTKNSKHTERKAFDIAIIKFGKVSWLTADYKKAVDIGTQVGLDCGGNWKKADYPHFQLREAV